MRRGFAIAAVGLTAVLGGCGDERKEFREEKLAPLQQAVKDERARMAAVLGELRVGDREQALALEEHVVRLERIHELIASLDPPDGIDGLFETYVEANERISNHFTRYAQLVKAQRRAGLARASKAAQRAIGDSDLARVDLDQALTREE